MKKYLLKLLLLFCLLSIFLTACQKDAPITPLVTTKPLTGSVSTTPAGDYQPLTKGSFWKYDNILATSVDVNTVTITGNTSKINRKTYYEAINDSQANGTTIGFYNNDGGVYRFRTTNAVVGITAELTFLDENKAVNETWTAPITDNGLVNNIPGRLVGKVVEKGISHTVNGKTFKDVIHTAADLQYDTGGYSTVLTYNLYYAKGIGLIEQVSTIAGVTIVNTKLVEYSIK
ncbi:hypothetical protein ABDD95_21825 [Mucilaginibacter sp. PAMB04274]|uniref:hypothetical protein n=1 Tax=Mucilaginibacter sp. PAMB04274 TaxID=3138568 RepID=UPI0031F605D8